MTLEEIKLFAIANNACRAQLDKFVEFIKKEDELSAWQTVLGNFDWLKENNFLMNINDIIQLANNIGKQWHDNGQLAGECNYVDGLKHGLYRRWHNNGQLSVVCNFVNGQRHNLYKHWYINGQLHIECNFVNGARHGLYQQWYDNGQLKLEKIY